MKKKHPFMCEKCGSECTIYRRGKAHRVFVCSGRCGVLATNGRVLKVLGKRGARALVGEIPGASLVMEGAGLVKDLTGKETKVTSTRTRSECPTIGEQIVLKEVYGGR